MLLLNKKNIEKGVNETMIAEFVARIKEKKWKEFTEIDKRMEEY